MWPISYLFTPAERPHYCFDPLLGIVGFVCLLVFLTQGLLCHGKTFYFLLSKILGIEPSLTHAKNMF